MELMKDFTEDVLSGETYNELLNKLILDSKSIKRDITKNWECLSFFQLMNSCTNKVIYEIFLTYNIVSEI